MLAPAAGLAGGVASAAVACRLASAVFVGSVAAAVRRSASGFGASRERSAAATVAGVAALAPAAGFGAGRMAARAVASGFGSSLPNPSARTTVDVALLNDEVTVLALPANSPLNMLPELVGSLLATAWLLATTGARRGFARGIGTSAPDAVTTDSAAGLGAAAAITGAASASRIGWTVALAVPIGGLSTSQRTLPLSSRRCRGLGLAKK